MPLPVFSDRLHLPAGAPHTVMLFPFWGKNPEDPGDPNTGRFDRYAEIGTRFFRLAPLEEAAFAVLPCEWTAVVGNPRARAEALRRLATSNRVATNFLVRRSFLGGAIKAGNVDAKTMQQVRREYVENMVESDYVLCARGAGNFSYRLYETLSCGRIPVFVDTDCVLPYEWVIDWRAHCVWVDAGELGQIGPRVLEFHESLSDDDFVELQRRCRELWEE